MSSPIYHTEDELVTLLQSNNEAAFSYLYENYYGALYNIAYKMLEDKELTEDVLQEAFVKIWNNILSYDRSKGRLFTWMLNITRNLTIDTLRSKGYKKQSKILSNEKTVDALSNIKSTGGQADFDAIGLKKHLLTLKSDQKLIIDMAYFEGYTQDEISKKLLIPLGTVKTKMRAAIMELRKFLK
ncbi:MAG: sigma-70 family RNA polymerase sigma factor [Bacteroidetes bacterium]|nr:sigma-70 family RNA polymerase sigma factor [Bacteroidota bacterium]